MLRRGGTAAAAALRRASSFTPVFTQLSPALAACLPPLSGSSAQCIAAQQRVSAAFSRGFSVGPGDHKEGERSSETPSTSGKGETAVPVTKVMELPSMLGFRDAFFGLEHLAGNLWMKLIKAGVETSFDEREFLDGSTDAFLTVMEKFAERDMEGLAPLTSKAVRDAFEGTWQQYDEQGMNMKFEVSAVTHATLVGGGMVSDDTLGETDLSETPKHFLMHGYKVSANKYRRLHLMMKVRFHSVETVELTEKATGKVTAQMEDRRGHVWHFGREVPPEMPVESLDTPWRLIRLE